MILKITLPNLLTVTEQIPEGVDVVFVNVTASNTCKVLAENTAAAYDQPGGRPGTGPGPDRVPE